MKLKKLLAVLLAGLTLTSNGVVAFANDVAVSGGTATSSTPTSFEADTNVLGGDLVVSIPAEMILTYDTANKKFTNSDVVYAKGRISPSKKLRVNVWKEIFYVNADDATIKVKGITSFGTAYQAGDWLREPAGGGYFYELSAPVNASYWSASDLLTGLTAQPVEQSLEVNVDSNDISYIGTYSTNITYAFDVIEKDYD